jgi:hypothetical protein
MDTAMYGKSMFGSVCGFSSTARELESIHLQCIFCPLGGRFFRPRISNVNRNHGHVSKSSLLTSGYLSSVVLVLILLDTLDHGSCSSVARSRVRAGIDVS